MGAVEPAYSEPLTLRQPSRTIPSLADDFFVVRDETGRVVMVQPKTDVGRGLVAESGAYTRIRDGMASGMTDEGLARIARDAGIADPEEFVARVKNVADTGPSGLFQFGGRPTLTFGSLGTSPLVAPAAGIPTPTAETVPQSEVPVAYTPPGRDAPSGVAVQHSPNLTAPEIATLIFGNGTPTTQLTFAPTPAEGITNAPPATVTSFVTAGTVADRLQPTGPESGPGRCTAGGGSDCWNCPDRAADRAAERAADRPYRPGRCTAGGAHTAARPAARGADRGTHTADRPAARGADRGTHTADRPAARGADRGAHTADRPADRPADRGAHTADRPADRPADRGTNWW